MEPPFFPEPMVADPRPGLGRETTWQFLHRSTWRRATETRAFYNDALTNLPPASRKPIMDALAAGQYESPLLEIVVGRFLQLRGGRDLTWEPEGEGGRHVDWRATFPEGVLHVEAMVPIYNASAGVTMRRQQRLLEYLAEQAPPGWWINPHGLPNLIESAPLGPFKARVRQLLAQLPPADTVEVGSAVELGRQEHAYEDRLWINAWRTDKQGGIGMHGGAAYYDNSESRIRAAWMLDKRKRSQGRSVPPPAVLALLGSFAGADLGDFENALFGRDVGPGHEPDGVMAVDTDPPWAGVLAFPTVSPAGAADPVLFVAPAYTGGFPDAIERLEVRRLTDRGVEVQAPRDTDVMAGMRWAKP